MKRKISQFLMLALMVVSVGFLGSCKDYDEDNYADLLSKLQDQNASLTDLLNAQIAQLESELANLQAKQSQCETNCQKKQAELEELINECKTACASEREKLQQQIDDLASDLATNYATKKELQDAVDQINSTIDKVKEDVKKNSDDIATLTSDLSALNQTVIYVNSRVDSLDLVVAAQGEQITQALKDAAHAQATADADSVYTHEMVELLQGVDDSLANELNDLKKYVDSLAVVSAKNFQTAIAIAKQGDKILQDQIDNIDVKLSELEKAYQKADQELQDQIDDLKKQVDQNTKDIAANKKAIDDLTGRIDQLQQDLAKQITSIIVQGTVNPVFGTFALPTDVRSNVLVAFYGNTSEDIEFPTTSTANYVWTNQALTNDEAKVIGSSVLDQVVAQGNTTLISTEDDNAGTIYVTVNPNTVDFTGKTLTLENSQAESAGITLSPLAKSDATLTFGYTRAANNGFYEATAKITADDIKNGTVQVFNFDRQGFKDIASDLVNNTSSFDITKAVTTVYNQFNGVLDANALTASYKDAMGETASIYSQYNVAATAVQPLSYAFAKDYYGRSTLPGYDRAEDFINRISNKITSYVDDAWPNALSTFSAPTINKINDDMSVTFSIRISTNGTSSRAYVDGDYLLVENNVLGTWAEVMKIRLNDKDAKVDKVSDNVYDLTITKSFEGMDDLTDDIDNLTSFVKDVNDVIGEINGIKTTLDSDASDIASILQDYLDRLNNKGISFINDAILRLQPMVLVKTSAEGTRMGTNTESYPMEIAGTSATLLLTSGTAEILTPAFKKHIACVNVIKGSDSAQKGNTTLLSKAQALNKGDLNKVLDGNVRSVEISGLESGYTYEFAYSAVDYSGKMSTKRCYIRVK